MTRRQKLTPDLQKQFKVVRKNDCQTVLHEKECCTSPRTSMCCEL